MEFPETKNSITSQNFTKNYETTNPYYMKKESISSIEEFYTSNNSLQSENIQFNKSNSNFDFDIEELQTSLTLNYQTNKKFSVDLTEENQQQEIQNRPRKISQILSESLQEIPQNDAQEQITNNGFRNKLRKTSILLQEEKSSQKQKQNENNQKNLKGIKSVFLNIFLKKLTKKCVKQLSGTHLLSIMTALKVSPLVYQNLKNQQKKQQKSLNDIQY